MKIKFFLPIILVSALSFSCNQQKSRPRVVENADNPVKSHQNTLINLRTGQSFVIDLPAPEQPEFNWYYDVSTNWIISIIEQIDLTTHEKNITDTSRPMSKLPPSTHFSIKGLKAGKVLLHFFVKRPEETKERYEHELFYEVTITE